ncbi:MAG: hypothetical protein NZ898_07590 [Myxococcota bacterium]|nr:hypothetical protein [Myxococcota bacterium]MDW8363037.1 hypothetical protein [Myxococcales bacterium]
MQERDVTSRVVALVDPVHGGWLALVDALHGADVALDLRRSQLPARLGNGATQAPEPASVARLLESYYRGDGNVEVGVRRRREDRWIVLRPECRPDASRFVETLRALAPELGAVSLRAHDGRARLVGPACHAIVPDVAGVRLTCSFAGTLSASGIVIAANQMLARVGAPQRWYPLQLGDTQAWLGLEPSGALVLQDIGLLDRDLDALRAYAALGRGPLVTVGARARGVA